MYASGCCVFLCLLVGVVVMDVHDDWPMQDSDAENVDPSTPGPSAPGPATPDHPPPDHPLQDHPLQDLLPPDRQTLRHPVHTPLDRPPPAHQPPDLSCLYPNTRMVIRRMRSLSTP